MAIQIENVVHVCDICGKNSDPVTPAPAQQIDVPLPSGWSRAQHNRPGAPYLTVLLCETHTAQFVSFCTTPQEPE